MLKGETPDPVYGKRGKQRSVHNTYFTLPVCSRCFQNHYAMTYTQKYNWAVLVLIMVAGALIRQFFVMRHRGQVLWYLPLAGVVLMAGALVCDAAQARRAASRRGKCAEGHIGGRLRRAAAALRRVPLRPSDVDGQRTGRRAARYAG